MKKKHVIHKRKLRHNLRPGMVVLILPLFGLLAVGWTIYTSYTKQYHIPFASSVVPQDRSLLTENATQVSAQLSSAIGQVERQFAYYKVKKFETVDKLSVQFGIPAAKITNLNPGPIVPGMTIKIPPVEQPLSAEDSNYQAAKTSLRLFQKPGDVVEVKGRDDQALTILTITDLADYTKQYGVFEEVSQRHWRLKKPIFINTNLRLQLTKAELDSLDLRSDPNNITCLCLENAQMLINGIKISSYTSADGQPDYDAKDQRSYIRARRSSRMDILNSDIGYLGNGIMKGGPLQPGGGTYGVSWRIPDERFGTEIATGWVEGSSFHHNYFGNFSFGASGITYRGNHYYKNDYYGLDPHDDSNNALVENNVFEDNGKHGFIVSKRCKYNIIRNNISKNNALHGFMLHADSDHNLIENNQAEGNVDNVAIFQSSYNIVRGNTLINPKKSNVRINQSSKLIAVYDNKMSGGVAINLYDDVRYVLIKSNNTSSSKYILAAKSQVSDVAAVFNSADKVAFKTSGVERIITQPNTSTSAESN